MRCIKKSTCSLVSRIKQLCDTDIDNENREQGEIPLNPAYKVFRGLYKDDKWRKVWLNGGKTYREEKGRGMIQFPFVFEILAIPLRKPTENKCRFVGAVNYSISPLSNSFEGDYRWRTETAYNVQATNILEVLEHYGFHRYYGSKSKISCVIVANLITPRRDPHGYDKSRIDTQPFAQVIADAVKKVAAEIPTFRGVGYRFSDESNYNSARWHSVKPYAMPLMVVIVKP